MILAYLAIGLSVGFLSIYLNLTSNEEIIKVVAAIVAVTCFFLGLFFAPLVIKLPLVAILLMSDKINPFKETERLLR